MAETVNLKKAYSALNEKLAKLFDESGVRRSFTVPYIEGQEMKDHIKISQFSAVTNVTNKDLQDKIDAIRKRMVNEFGYIDESAQDVLMYVSSIFARGDVAEAG